MDIAFLLYENMTALDLVGPYQVLAGMPGTKIHLVAKTAGPKRTDTGLSIVAEEPLSAVPSPDIIVVPGSSDPSGTMADEAVLAWLREASGRAKWTTSVCTGALILGAAGLLHGRRATTHWLALEGLRAFDAEPVQERVVVDGRFITAAGVSAGIDMALRLVALEVGEGVAQTIQLMIEYDPAPPFHAGSPKTAPKAIVETAVAMFGGGARPLWG